MNRVLIAVCVSLVLTTLNCGTIWAQATAQMGGMVRDQSGAVLPGAEVTATQTETGVSRTTITNETGSYVMPNLPLGAYRLEAGLPGFRTFVQSGILLQVNSNLVINVVLEVGQVSEQVEVQANASLVETRSVGVGRIMETERIVELPLNGRNAQELMLLAGGTVAVPLSGSSTFPGRLLISSAGALGPSTDYSLDGIRHVDAWDGQGMPLPFPDALAEFKTETSGLNAQQARSSAVSAVTKSGTNAFHGDLFEFVRNDLFNARNYFATTNSTLKRNQFGGTIGGPIKRNKLFFFAGYQGTTVRQDPADVRQFVPTAAMLTGDFTAFASAACNTRGQVTLKAPFNNNTIDPALFSPAAVKLAARLPKTQNPCGEFKFGRVSNDDRKESVGKLDYQLNDKHSLFGRVLWAYDDVPPPYKYTPDIAMNAVTGTSAYSKAVALGSTYLINPTTVNSLRVAYSGQRNTRILPALFGPKDLGINMYGLIPNIDITVTGGFSLSSSTGDFRTHFYQVTDDVSMTRGTHQFGFGVYLGQARANKVTSTVTSGSFNFTGGTTGLGLADFLTGKASDFNQGSPQDSYSRQNYRTVYGQDTWQISRRLTMNYGVRWTPVLSLRDVRRPVPTVLNFDIDRYRQGLRSTVFVNAPPGFLYVGDPGFQQSNNGTNAKKPQANVYDDYWFKFAPRLGLAWDVQGDGRTSLRASYGLNYEDLPAVARQGSQLGQGPWGAFVRVLTPVGGFDDPWRGFPGGNPFPLELTKNMLFPALGDYMPLRGDVHPLYTQSWNFSLQREVMAGTLLSVSYLGTQLTHVTAADPINQAIFIPGTGDASGSCFLNGQAVYFKVAPGAACSTVPNTQSRRRLSLENPAFAQEIGRMATISNGGTQNYHGLLVSLQRRPSRGVNVNGNYTWSHCIGDYTGRANNGNGSSVTHTYLDPTNRRRDRANCESDQRHIFNLTAVAETPQFANRTARWLAAGWRLSGIYRASTSSSGSAYRTVGLGDPPTNQQTAAGIDPCLCDIAGQRPNLVLADIYKDKSGGPLTQYLNPAAFAVPAPGTLGNAGRGIVKLPYAWQFDLALARVFRFRESQSLEFRAEAYNVTNSFRPGDINLNLTSSQFGQIRTSLEPRIMQFALKYLF
jgi:hypothetical protein